MMDSSKSKYKKRFWEIDFLRGIAIVMMITFHSAFNLYYFEVTDINANTGFWWFLARSTATIFIFLVGVSLTLSYSKTKHFKSGNKIWIKYISRGVKIFSWGLLITILTWYFIKEGYIIFGILHFIGLSIMLAMPFVRYKFLNLLIGSIVLIIGFYIGSISVGFRWLLWIGLRPDSFYTVDYFPLLPWFGLILYGICTGNILYSGYERQFDMPDLSSYKIIKFFSYLGKNSLIIYLLHQPVIILILIIFGIIEPSTII